MKTVPIKLDEIYVPVKHAGTLDNAKVEELAEDILENGLREPIHVRRDDAKKRYVLVAGLHRLEAMRALGEEDIGALVVQARKF